MGASGGGVFLFSQSACVLPVWIGICPPDTPAKKSWLQIGELWLYTSSSSMDKNLIQIKQGNHNFTLFRRVFKYACMCGFCHGLTLRMWVPVVAQEWSVSKWMPNCVFFSVPSHGLFFILGKVCEDECAFLRWQLVLFLSGLLQELFPHHSEHWTQQCPAEDLSGLVPGQAVAELRHIAVAEPSTAQEQLCLNTASGNRYDACLSGHLAALPATSCSWLYIPLHRRWEPFGASGRASPAANSWSGWGTSWPVP